MTTPPDAISEEVVFAAIERAALHRQRETGAVPVWVILEHLSVERRPRGRYG